MSNNRTTYLPSKLIAGFNQIKRSRVVLDHDVNDESLEYFQNIINETQPSTDEERLINKFSKGLYRENKNKWLHFIRNTNATCLVLWTDAMTIVDYFCLRGIVYLRENNQNGTFTASKFISRISYYSPENSSPTVKKQLQYYDERGYNMSDWKNDESNNTSYQSRRGQDEYNDRYGSRGSRGPNWKNNRKVDKSGNNRYGPPRHHKDNDKYNNRRMYSSPDWQSDNNKESDRRSRENYQSQDSHNNYMNYHRRDRQDRGKKQREHPIVRNKRMKNRSKIESPINPPSVDMKNKQWGDLDSDDGTQTPPKNKPAPVIDPESIPTNNNDTENNSKDNSNHDKKSNTNNTKIDASTETTDKNETKE